ncbi:MAG: metallophosphoesterase [Magnetococcales bacterium]|nr:metallophosphoesterase [Magnetococcales bacterium]
MKAIFFSVIMIVYGLFHLAIWRRVRTIFSMGKTGSGMVLIVLLALFFSVFLSHGVYRWGWFSASQSLFRVGTVWLGCVFIFFQIELLLIILFFIQKLFYNRGKIITWRQKPEVFYLSVAIAILVSIYGFFEAGHLEVTRLAMTSPLRRSHSDPVKIMQISDVHYGQFVIASRHENLLEIVRHENPDMIVSTGDFIDFGGENQAWIMDQWHAVQPPLGKFAVLGNHESMTGIPVSLALLERGGFQVLRNDWVSFDGFTVLGVDDPSTHDVGVKPFDQSRFPHQDSTVVLLYHQPVWPEKLAGLFDLGLSGHTHGGQIFPFGVMVYWANGVLSGLRTTPWGGWYYINRGTGTWGPPIRVGAAPEITVITLNYGNYKKVSIE